MTDEQLERNLKSVGQACFVNYFELFASPSTNRTEIIETLKKETDYTEKSCISRTGHSQSIIRAGRASDALKLIIGSNSVRVSRETRKKAEELLLNL